jgi:hypothetical protein
MGKNIMFSEKEKNRVTSLLKSIKGSETTIEKVKSMILSRDGGANDPVIIDDWVSNAAVVCYRNIITEAKHLTDEAIAHQLMKSIWRESFKLSGMVPSEAAVIYQESLGAFPIFTSAKEIFRQKTCAELPKEYSPKDEGASALLRVIMLRKNVIEIFRARYSGLNLTPFDDGGAIEDFMKKTPEDMPWARPSFGFDILQAPTKELLLVNYKCPVKQETADDYGEEIPVSDVASFAYMNMILERIGIKIDNHALVVLDPYMTMKMHEVKGVHEIQDDVKKACEEFWNKSVKVGMTPKRELSKNFQSVRDVPLDLHNDALRLATASSLKNSSEKIITETKRKILDKLKGIGVSLDELMTPDKNSGDQSSKIQISALSISQKMIDKIDNDALLKSFLDEGGKMEAIRSKGYDPEMLKLKAEALGIDLKEYTKTTAQHRFNVSRSKNNPDSEMLSEIVDITSETLEDLLSEVAGLLEKKHGEIPKRQKPELIEQSKNDEDFVAFVNQPKADRPVKKAVEHDVPL